MTGQIFSDLTLSLISDFLQREVSHESSSGDEAELYVLGKSNSVTVQSLRLLSINKSSMSFSRL
jgi:hypothetical protein